MSDSAREKIEKAGGTVNLIAPRSFDGPRHPAKANAKPAAKSAKAAKKPAAKKKKKSAK